MDSPHSFLLFFLINDSGRTRYERIGGFLVSHTNWETVCQASSFSPKDLEENKGIQPRNLLHFYKKRNLFFLKKTSFGLIYCTPNQQRTVDRLPPEFRCRNFVNEHRPSMQVGRQSVRRTRTCNVHAFRLSFHFACHRWRLGSGTVCCILMSAGGKCPLLHTYCCVSRNRQQPPTCATAELGNIDSLYCNDAPMS